MFVGGGKVWVRGYYEQSMYMYMGMTSYRYMYV